MEATPPFSNIDPVKGVQGLALDSVNALVEMNGHQLKPIICPFARCLRLIEQGQADFIFGIMKTPERSAYLEYIEPAFITSFSEIRFYTLRDAKTSIKSLADVEKLRVGVQRGASHFEAFDNNKLIRKLDVSSISNLIDMLKTKRIDTFVMPRISAEEYLKQHDENSEIMPAHFTVIKEQGGYIAISKKSPYINDVVELNRALLKIKKSGDLTTILKRYNIE